MVLVGEVEPAVSDPRDELADADVITSGGEDFGAFAASRWPQLVRLAGAIRSRRARIIPVLVLAGLVAATAWLVPRSHPASRSVPVGQPAVITNSTAGLGFGVFARGTADGQQWQLTVQDIADPGYPCLPGVSINGNDADPLFADSQPLRHSPVGSPAFVTLGPRWPDTGFAFIQVPADADWLWLDPVRGFQLGVAPVMVSACGQQFRLAGFAYPLTATLRIHLSFRDRPEGSYTVPSGTDRLTAELSDGSSVSARPLVVDGRKYAAFFVPGQLRVFWLNWVDATGRPIAGTTGLPGYGYIQFWPSAVPAMKAYA